MSALSLYATVCRQLFESNFSLRESNDEAWDETARKLRRLRQALQCRVCKRIRRYLYGSASCHHLTCRECKDKKRGNIGGCRFCKSPDGLELDKQHNAVLKCYAKVCELLQSYRVAGIHAETNKRIDKVWELINEGVTVFEENQGHETLSVIQNRTAGNSVSKQDRYSDVGHSVEENKVTQNGGLFKDGSQAAESLRFCGDFAPIKSPEIVDNCIEEFEKIENSNKSDTGLDKTDLSMDNGISAEKAEEKMVPKLFARKDKNSSHFKLVSKLADEETMSAKSFTLQGHMQNGRMKSNSESSKNGFIVEKSFPEKDITNSSHLKPSMKRKIFSSDLHEDSKSTKKLQKETLSRSSPVRLNRKTMKQNLDECDEVFHEEASPLVECSHKEVKSSSKKYSVLKGRKLHGNVPNEGSFEWNGNRQHGLMRKNKYKCSCGSSTNARYFSDMCSHNRCACYAAGVPCVACKCKYCSNPHQSHYNVKWSSLGFEAEKQTIS